MRGSSILQFAQTRFPPRRIDDSASATARAPNAPDKALLEIATILAAAVGTALGVNLLLLAFHIA